MLEFKHLPWPGYYKELFIKGPRDQWSTFLDVYHPARHFYDSHIKDREQPNQHGTLLRWDPADRLADVFLATFGGYPAKVDSGIDYEAFFKDSLAAQEIEMTPDILSARYGI